MTVYFDPKRNVWRYNFYRGKKRYSGYCIDATGAHAKTKSAAKEAEGVAKRLADIEPKLPRAEGLSISRVVAAIIPRLQLQAQWSNKQRYLRDVVAYFGPETAVASISKAMIDDYITHSLQQPLRVWRGGPNRDPADPANDRFWTDSGKTRTQATVNRYLPVLREIFDRAYNTFDPITRQRAITEIPKFSDLQEPKRKARPIPDNVLSKVISTLPTHVVDALVASLYFGFRCSEIFEMEIPDVDFERGGVWLKAENVKDHEDAFLPGAPAAMEHMAKLVAQARDRGTMRLISWRRYRKDPANQAQEPWLPMKSPKTAWATAMDKIEEEFGRRWRWHDIRAAYITQVALTAGPVAAQHLARHSEYRTTQGYVAVADETLRAGANMAADRPSLAVLRGGKSEK